MSRYTLDKILVVDLEATCWQGDPPPDQEKEIIEIGICTLNTKTGQRKDRESILVKPTRSTVSAFCTELTTLTQEQVAEGVSFATACRRLVKRYKAPQRVWASYGDYDRIKFQEQCASFGVDYPFGKRHINVKTLFALMHGLRREVGMARALKMRSMPLEGIHHRGHFDAWNTAALLAELLNLGQRDSAQGEQASD